MIGEVRITVAQLRAALARCPGHYFVYVNFHPLGCLRRAPDSLRVYLHTVPACRDILMLHPRRRVRLFQSNPNKDRPKDDRA